MLKNYLTLVIIPQKASRVLRLVLPGFLLKILLVLLVIGSSATLWVIYDYVILLKQQVAFTETQRELRLQKLELKRMEVLLEDSNASISGFQKFDTQLRIVTSTLRPEIQSTLNNRQVEIEDIVYLNQSNTAQPALQQLFDNQDNILKARFNKITKDIYLQTVSFYELQSVLYENQDRLERTPLIWPVTKKSRRTSGYGIRIDPFTGTSRFHHGIDLAYLPNTPIYSTGDGTVTATLNDAGGFGFLLVINHGYGIQTRYGHLSKFEVKVGTRVERGKLIARVGNTGRSTGPHLHYEILVRGKSVNPEFYMLD